MQARKVACPYCYEAFWPWKIRLVCTGQTSMLDKKCTLRVDEVLLARRGVRRELGPDFHPGGLFGGAANLARCPSCSGRTTYRICPVCHSELPAQFGMVGSQMIGMAGAKESGKTVYMTVALHELLSQVGAQHHVAIMGADDETLRRFSANYESRLYTEGDLPDVTPRAAAAGGRVDPLVFRFTTTRGGPAGSRVRPTLTSFFDTSGEDFQSAMSLAQNTRYLERADGIMLIVDALQLDGARKRARPGTRMPGTDYEIQNPMDVLSRVTNLLQQQNGWWKLRPERIDRPVAVVFTKLDALWDDDVIKPGSPLQRMPPDTGRFDTADSLDVHEQIRDLLLKWDGADIDANMRGYYPRHRFFGVSSLGAPPTADNRVSATGIHPYRVADPLLWLLSEFGSVARTSDGR